METIKFGIIAKSEFDFAEFDICANYEITEQESAGYVTAYVVEVEAEDAYDFADCCAYADEIVDWQMLVKDEDFEAFSKECDKQYSISILY